MYSKAHMHGWVFNDKLYQDTKYSSHSGGPRSPSPHKGNHDPDFLQQRPFGFLLSINVYSWGSSFFPSACVFGRFLHFVNMNLQFITPTLENCDPSFKPTKLFV